MNLIRKLSNDILTAIIVSLITIIGFTTTSFLLTTSYISIPLGILLSGGIIAITHVICHLFIRLDERRGSATFTIVAIMLRLVIYITTLTLITMMYYRWNIKYFNIFAFVGMYTVGTAIYMLTYILNKSRKE